MLHEVTERGDTEEQDRLGESRFQAIFEGVAIGMAVADKHCRIVKTNRALQAMLGYSAEELRAMDFCAISHPDDARSHLDCFRDMFAGRKPSQRLDKRYVRKDGTIVWGQVSISLVRQPDEEPYAVVMVEDVTERKITEKKLRERDEQYHSIFEATSDGIIITDADGVVVEANPAACAMHGYRPDEFVGLHETAYVAPVHHELLIEQAKAIV
ncbi:MAG: PAS domain-containing protein, partial [Chloroflexota bacterium]